MKVIKGSVLVGLGAAVGVGVSKVARRHDDEPEDPRYRIAVVDGRRDEDEPESVPPGQARREPGRGREADEPEEIPARGWKDIAVRVKGQVRDDNLPLLAAGVAFYTMLALFPALIALVSIYGLIADPGDITKQLESFLRAMPTDAANLVVTQLKAIVESDTGGLTVGAILGILGVLWSASSGIQALVKAINAAYDEKETRKPLKLRLLALAFTGAAIVGAVVLAGVAVVVPALLRRVGLGTVGEWAVSILRWPVVAVLLVVALAVVYRYAPNRDNPRWR